jgi:hypothetical protein
MRPAEEGDLPSTGYRDFDLVLRDTRAWLAERGELVVGSGSFRAGPLSGSVHSDFGPPAQDKATNQDYVLAWLPAGRDRPRLRCVLARGDGLTNSFRSECASALACWVGVRALAESFRGADSKELARLAFAEAGLAIGRLADSLAADSEASCPEDQFLSTWKYILKKGGLFQTTLTLAWLDEDCFRIAMVGDGGAFWRGYNGPPNARQATDRVLAACDLATQQVCALGPADRRTQEFDCWHEERVNGPFQCALMTDGIGRGLGGEPLALLDELDALQAAGVENPARRFIEQAIQRPKDFDDNLTLAILRAE